MRISVRIDKQTKYVGKVAVHRILTEEGIGGSYDFGSIVLNIPFCLKKQKLRKKQSEVFVFCKLFKFDDNLFICPNRCIIF